MREEREDFRPSLDASLHRPAEPCSPSNLQGWVTSRKCYERDLAETLDGFLFERNKSLTWLQGLSTPNWEAEYRDQHGSIKAGNMFTSWAAHDNLHIRQLVELRRARIVNLAEPYDVGYAGEW